MRAGELGPFWAIIRAIALCPVLAGCIVGIPSLGEPSRMLTVTDEIPPVGTVENRLFEQYLATVNSSPTAAKTYRNEYITARMSAIDMAYTNYEIALTDESGGTDFGATVSKLGLDDYRRVNSSRSNQPPVVWDRDGGDWCGWGV
jgi:hypothetical protein